MLSGAHGGLVAHAGAFCPVHQCPNSSEATSWETAWETLNVRTALPSPPPSPTVATGSQTMTDRLAIGRGVRDKRGAAIVTISEVIMGNIALTDAI